MPDVNFEYKCFEKYKRPVVPVGIFFKGKKTTFDALIDSGADYTMLNSEIAQQMGLSNYKNGIFQKVDAASGSVGGYKWRVQLLIGKYNIQTTVIFVEKWSHNYSLIGQIGVFDEFVVTFDKRNGKIRLIKQDNFDSLNS